MNYRMVSYLIGQLMRVEGLLMILPLLCAVIYQENMIYTAFIIPIVILVALGSVLTFRMPQKREIYAKEGFIVVGLSWVMLSVFGALPFMLSGTIPHFCDAVFETASGLTTTGASILTGVETLPKGILFWRSFTHWIGGMGVLVFTLAVLPKSNDRSLRLMHVMRAEVPGPVVGKLVSRIKSTARILYGIYIALTLVEILLLWAVKMPLFDAICNTFGTAGTGGFGIWNDSIAHYHSAYVDGVVSVFMLLFSINFNVYYLILVGQIRPALKNSEVRWYLSIIALATAAIMYDLRHVYAGVLHSFRYAFFQVMTVISTTGFSTTDYNQWPILSRTILATLMFVGACVGSTGGGLKVGRLMLLVKTFVREVRYMLHPRSVRVIRTEGKRVDEETIRGTASYFIAYMCVFTLSVLLLAVFDEFDLVTNFTAVASCLNNIGPGLGNIVGPSGNFSLFTDASKVLLTFDMLAGRLELFPMLMLFSPTAWKNH